jgi:small subunit ribosomal protein S11
MVGGKSGKGRALDRAADSFLPTSISQLTKPDANQTKPPPLPQIRSSGQHPGYFYIHGVSTTKNIHVTIADHEHNPVVVTSGGRHGLKHSKRQTIEAGYTTTVAALEKFAKSNYEVTEVEIVLKGFGQGRKGFLSALEGHHGEFIRRKVVRVTDATPMQIGLIKARNKKRS